VAGFFVIRGRVLAIALLEVVRVLLGVGGPLARHVRVWKDCLNWTLRLTCSTVDAFVRMDIKLILTLVDAVDGTDFNATRVLSFDAGFGDDVGHGSCWSGRFCRAPKTSKGGPHVASISEAETFNAEMPAH